MALSVVGFWMHLEGGADRSNVGVGAEWRVVLGASLALGVVRCEERGDCGRGGSWTSHAELG